MFSIGRPYLVPIRDHFQALLSVQFINEDFFRWARPHPAVAGLAARRTLCTPQPETRGERSPAEKRPMDGHYLTHHFNGLSGLVGWHTVRLSVLPPIEAT
jgi:hypothetical protein